MDRRPSAQRGHSDPTELSRNGSLERRTSNPAVRSGSTSPEVPRTGSDSHPMPSISIDQSGELRSPTERRGVRFGGTGAAPAAPLHQPLSLAEAKPKRSNFLGSRQHSDVGSNDRSGSADQSPQSSSPQPPEASPPPTSSGPQQIDRGASEGIAELSRPEPALLGQSVASESASGSGKTDAVSGISPLTSPQVGEMAAQTARSRAEKLSQSLAPKASSAPGSKINSPQSSPPPSPELYAQPLKLPKDMTSFIPLQKLPRRKYGIDDESDSEDEHGTTKRDEGTQPSTGIRNAARRLLRFHTTHRPSRRFRSQRGDSRYSSGQTTPERDRDANYVERPDGYRRSVLGVILDLYGDQGVGAALNRHEPGVGYYRHQNELRSGQSTPTGGKEPKSGQSTPVGGSPGGSRSDSGQTSPKPKIPVWHEKTKLPLTSLSSLVQSSAMLSAPGASKSGKLTPNAEPGRRGSGTPIPLMKGGGRVRPRDHHVRVNLQLELEDLLARHEYMIKSCKGLMRFGAPTHRLEEYMRRSARKLELDGQFLYMPGCMVISFDSPDTRTAEVKIIRESQGVDLAKLRTMHDIYKGVIHDKMSIPDANIALDYLMAKGPLYNKLVCIFFYGLASASVGPFAFGARPVDMPIAFVLGAVLGYLQLIVSARSESYQNVFEISAAVVTSFAARGFGSISGGSLFCFSALAQSAIALILPGFIVLSAALELQSRNIVAGSIRMVYAIIYSLFLGFGITIGVAFYGAVDPSATSDTECHNNPLMSEYWKFIFVPVFTLSLCVVNQARLKQMPMMVLISFAGYVVNFFSARRFATNAQIANTLGALTVGLIGNLYSRLYHGMSAAAMLPAIFVQVPSGIAASGSLISGVVSANQINSNSSGTTTVANGAQAGSSGINVNNTVFNVGYTMIQIAIGLTVGLFFSSLLVYPFGKKRSGLFSF